jgi:small-conductance mechanosensitive channel
MQELIALFRSQNIHIQRMLISIAVLLAFWLLDRLIFTQVIRKIEDKKIRYQWKKITSYSLAVLALISIGLIWIDGLRSLATFFGLLAAGMAIAFKDPLENILGWAYILIRKPFEVGDRIQINENAGDVIDTHLFRFSLMEIGNWVDADQSTGRVLHIPNGLVFRSVIAIYTKGSDYIWNEIPVLITFESNWHKTREILETISKQYAEESIETARQSFEMAGEQFLIRYGKLTPKIYLNVKESGVELTMRHLCEPRNRRETENRIWENILIEFAKHQDIDFAYPTQRFYTHPVNSDR